MNQPAQRNPLRGLQRHIDNRAEAQRQLKYAAHCLAAMEARAQWHKAANEPMEERDDG